MCQKSHFNHDILIDKFEFFVSSLNVYQAESFQDILTDLANLVWERHEKELVEKIVQELKCQEETVFDHYHFNDNIPF